MKKKPKYNQNSVIRGALRRAFARSPAVQEVMNASRREIPRYTKSGERHKKNWVQRECQVCGAWVSTSKMAVDHINPVVSVDEGFQDWNAFVARLWCDASNLQRICDTCHDKKTQEERIARLKIKYMQELDAMEYDLAKTAGMRNLVGAATNGYKDLIKQINKYIAKKKTIGLEEIVERALKIKEQIVAIKTSYDKT